MRKKNYIAFVLVMIISMLLGACANATSPLGNGKSPVQAVPPAQTLSPSNLPAETQEANSTPAAVNRPPAATPVDALPPQVVLTLFTRLMNNIPATADYGYIQANALKAALALDNKPYLLDVRESSELTSTGYIAGAVNIPLRSLLGNLDKLPKLDSSIVIYSNSGNRSGMALASLMLLGYTNVSDLAGGFSSWVQATQYPIVTGQPPITPSVLNPNPVINEQAIYDTLNSFLRNLPDDYYQIDAVALSQQIKGAKPPTLIDINTASDHQQYGRIQGAVDIGFSEFFNSIGQLPSKDTPIVIYDVGGGNSAILIMGLRLMGYKNVLNLKGGIIRWRNQGLPVPNGTSN